MLSAPFFSFSFCFLTGCLFGRDVRYGVPRSASLSADEQQRMQQYNQLTSGRNTPQANVSPQSPGARVLPGSNAKGIVNRSMPMARSGFQGVASSSIVNSGSMVTPSMPLASMQSGQGSSTLRPREALHMMRVWDLFFPLLSFVVFILS